MAMNSQVTMTHNVPQAKLNPVMNLTDLTAIRCLHELRKHVIRNAQMLDSDKTAQRILHSIHAGCVLDLLQVRNAAVC